MTTTLSAQIRGARRNVMAADAELDAALKDKDHAAVVTALAGLEEARGYHNTLMVSQIEQRDAAMRRRMGR